MKMKIVNGRRMVLALIMLALFASNQVKSQDTTETTSPTTTLPAAVTSTDPTASSAASSTATTTITTSEDPNTTAPPSTETTISSLATTTVTTETATANDTNPTTSTTLATTSTTTTTIPATTTTTTTTPVSLSWSILISSSSSTTTASSDAIISSDNSSTARTLGILLAFTIVGIVLAVGALCYFNRRQVIHANKYVTLADKLNSRSSRPPSPTHHGGTTISMNETGGDGGVGGGEASADPTTGQANRAFGFEDDFVNKSTKPPVDDPDFKFNFDEFQYQEKPQPPQRMGESTL